MAILLPVIFNFLSFLPPNVSENSCPENLFQFESSVFCSRAFCPQSKAECQVEMGQINDDISIDLLLMFFCFLILKSSEKML